MRVQCYLHFFRKFSAPGTIKHSLHSYLSSFLPTQVDSGITCLDNRFWHSPRKWNESLCHGSRHPTMVFGAESSSKWFLALVKCVMGLHTGRCLPVGCFGNVIHLLLFSYKRKPFCTTFCVGCLLATYASCWFCIIAGWLVMSWSQLCITLVGEGSYPLAIGPTLGARFGLSWVYPPSWGSGSCTGAMVWIKDSTLWILVYFDDGIILDPQWMLDKRTLYKRTLYKRSCAKGLYNIWWQALNNDNQIKMGLTFIQYENISLFNYIPSTSED